MGRVQRGLAVDYGVALLAMAAALALRWALGPWLGDRLPYVTLFGAVAVAVWVGGLGPALLAAVVGFGAADRSFLVPLEGPALASAFAGYATSCGLIIGSGEGLRRARARLQQEVQERRRAERAALSHAERLDATLVSIGDGVIVTDAEGRVQRLNPVAERLTGWTSPEASGKPLGKVFEIVNEDSRRPVENPALRALSEGAIVGLANHTVLIARDGSERPIDDSAAPIRGPGGRVEGVVLVFRDIGRRRAVERDLARTGQTLQTMIAAAPIATVVVDPDPPIVRLWNPAAEALFGWSAEEAVGRRAPFLPKDALEDCARLCAELAAGRALSDRHATRLCRDGRSIEVRLSAATLRDSSGRVSRLLLMFSDATEARRAAAADARLAAVVRHASEAILTARFDGTVWSWNPAAEALFGWSAQERVGRPLQELTPPERAEEERRLLATLRAGEPIRLETVRLARDGRPVDVLLSLAPLRDERERPIGFSAFYQDISARRAAEMALRRSEQTLRAMYEGSSLLMGVVELLDDGDLLHVHDNTMACAMLGVPPGGTANRRSSELGASADTIALWRRHCLESARSGELSRFEFELQGPGGPRFYAASVTPIGLGESGRTRFSYVAEDITPAKEAEQARQTLDRRKDRFLATLAHELRNPLAPIRSGLGVLQLAGDQAPVRERTLQTIERQFAQLVRLVDDLMDLSRIGRDQLELRRERLDLAQVVQNAVETGQPLIQTRGHRLTVKLPSRPVRVDGDATRLSQVLTNLLNNAAKYTPPEGRIEIELAADEHEAWVTLEDTGIGIPAEMLPRVFDMFVQADRSSERSGEGLGIGLAISRRLVELHGGRIAVRSDGAGLGSRFTVHLPLAAPQPDDAVAGRPQAQRGSGRRILIVDDNADAAVMLAELLRLLGHAVEVAFDGAVALARAEALRPEVALLDLGMPGLDGFEVAARLRALPWAGALVLVAVTGWGQAGDRARTAGAGFDHHLVKPIDPADVERLVAAPVEDRSGSVA